VKAEEILNILQLLYQVTNDLFIEDFKEKQDWPAQGAGQVTLFSSNSVHHAEMPKLRENLKQNKPEFKLICQFSLVSICEDRCILRIDNCTGFGKHKWTKALIEEVMKPTVLKVMQGNLEVLSRQLQSRLRISHEDLVKVNISCGKTTDHGLQGPVAIGPRERGCFSQSPCLFMKCSKPGKLFKGGK